MSHLVGGAMGVTYVMMTCEGDIPGLKLLHHLIKYSYDILTLRAGFA